MRMREQLSIFLSAVNVDVLNPDWDVEGKNRVGHALGGHPHHPLAVPVELHTLFGLCAMGWSREPCHGLLSGQRFTSQ